MSLRLDELRVLLCDADAILFPSEEPAFEASTAVTNRLLADLGIPMRFDADELRRAAVGRNFRSTAAGLAAAHGVALADEELELRVREERDRVIEHLTAVLRPDPAVTGPVASLAARLQLAVVSSSALARLDACLTATGLAELFPLGRRFSAEDSLPVPTSKPDPAVYAFAGRRLGVARHQALAIEDSVTGARSAVAAGFPTVGNLQFVAAADRAVREADLHACGVVTVVASWAELVALLEPGLGGQHAVPADDGAHHEPVFVDGVDAHLV